MDYYRRFQLITHLFFFRSLIRSAYARGVGDLARLGVTPKFTRSDFACLLCGVSGEITAEEFIEFVLAKNQKAKITIIDYGEEQVAAVQKLVSAKYADRDIAVMQLNALKLTERFGPRSFDWIETDGLIEYFDKPSLKSLLNQWKTVIKPGGFITTRDFASSSLFGSQVDRFRMWFIKKHLTLTGHIHTKRELDEMFTASGFRFVSGPTPVPTLKRYVLIVNKS